MLDNDAEAKGVLELLANKFKKNSITYDQNKNFVCHVISNLYVVLLPKAQSVETNKIKDLFDPSVMEKVLEGKTFSPENAKKFDNQRHYSKQVLATKIVRPEQNTIDFSKFQPILELISQVLEKYKAP